MPNPLELDDEFQLTLMNPNPSFRTRKDGDHYFIDFEISKEEWEHFTDPNIDRTGMVLELTGMVTHRAQKNVSGSPNADSTPAPESKPYGAKTALLHKAGFFLNPMVLKHIGSDAQFLEWIRTQPCAASHLGDCEGDVVAAHVRRIANGAGMGIKPDNYSAIPLCHKHHMLQHQKGESALVGDRMKSNASI